MADLSKQDQSAPYSTEAQANAAAFVAREHESIEIFTQIKTAMIRFGQPEP